MSYYDDDRSRRSRGTRTEVRRRSDDYSDDEVVYKNTRNNTRSTALVKRRDSSSDFVEEKRETSPGGGYYRETIIRKSGSRPAGGRSRDYDDDYDDDRSVRSHRRQDSYYASSRRSRGYDDEDDRRSDRRRSKYNDDSDSRSRSRSPPPKKKERSKSVHEEALEALGLGGVLAALTGKKSDSRSDSRDRGGRAKSRSGRDGDRSKSHGREQAIQAVKAAVLSGAVEAFRSRKEPGGFKGDKGKRILTAAITAGGVDGLINNHKDPEKHKLLDTVGSALAGVATSRIVNGARSRSRGPAERRPGSPDNRGRSSSLGGTLLSGGALGALAERFRSRSRGGEAARGRSRSRSYDSRDSRSPPRERKRDRSRSVVARGLDKLGLTSAADRVDPYTNNRRDSRARDYSRDRRDSRYDEPRYSNDPYVNNQFQNYDVSQNPRDHSLSQVRALGPGGVALDSTGRERDLGPSHDPGQERAIYDPASNHPPPTGYKLDFGPRHTGDPDTDSSSDLGSSSEDEKRKKKTKRKMWITGGLAAVATIHAGHSVYASVDQRQARKRALREGKITRKQAEENKRKDQLQDVASVGLAALGLKGAYSEWKEVKESREQFDEARQKEERHAYKRMMRRRKDVMMNEHGGSNGLYLENGRASSMPPLRNDYAQHAPPQPPAAHDHLVNSNVTPAPPYQSTRNESHYYDDNPFGYMDHHEPVPPPPQHVPSYEPPAPSAAPPPQYQVPYPNPYDPHNTPAAPGGTGFPPPPVGGHG